MLFFCVSAEADRHLLKNLLMGKNIKVKTHKGGRRNKPWLLI